MNKVILIGRLTKDPEMRATTSGVNTTTFTVAVNRAFTNQNGGRDADFINCVAWRRQAENIAKYCTKGTQVAVEGRIQTRSYDAPDGNKRYVTEVVADNVTFLSSKGAGASASASFAADAYQPDVQDMPMDIETSDISEDPFKDFGNEVALSDDDLPF